MDKKTAADLRAYLSTFEAQYPFKQGYIAHLILNEKLSIADICKRIKNILQTEEPDRQIRERALETSVNKVKKNTVKKVNYSQQWTNLLKMNQEPFAIPFKSQQSHSSAADPPLIQPDHASATIQPDHASATIQPDHASATIQPDHASATVQPDHASATIQPDYASATIQPDHASATIQPDHASATIQPDHASAQNTSETQLVVDLTSLSVNNHSECFLVCSGPPSPKRLKRDCDSCINKQRTYLNLLEKNKSLRLQIRTLKQQHRQERKRMSFKLLNEKIRRQSQAAARWRSKYKMLRRRFKVAEKVNGSIHKTEEKLLTKVFEEEHKKLICSVEYLRSELAVTDTENAHLRIELHKLKDKLTCKVQKMKTKLSEERDISLINNYDTMEFQKR